MDPTSLNILSAGVLINLPIMGFIFGVLWKMNETLTSVKTKVTNLESHMFGDNK